MKEIIEFINVIIAIADHDAYSIEFSLRKDKSIVTHMSYKDKTLNHEVLLSELQQAQSVQFVAQYCYDYMTHMIKRVSYQPAIDPCRYHRVCVDRQPGGRGCPMDDITITCKSYISEVPCK